MSDDEMDRLADLLDRYGDSEQGLTLEALDGFLSALIVGPGAMVMPSEYLPDVWACEPQFQTEQDARDALTLIMRLNNHIVWRLSQDPDSNDPAVYPLVMTAADEEGEPLAELPEGYPLGVLWASGFLRGVQFRLDDWQQWCETHASIASDFAAIVDLTVLDANDLPDVDNEGLTPPTLDQRQDIVDDLADILLNMNAQRLHDLRPPPARRAHDAGRNDLCPCGSGQKYKRCCGAPSRLH